MLEEGCWGAGVIVYICDIGGILYSVNTAVLKWVYSTEYIGVEMK
jgi:hypothetical protein